MKLKGKEQSRGNQIKVKVIKDIVPCFDITKCKAIASCNLQIKSLDCQNAF